MHANELSWLAFLLDVKDLVAQFSRRTEFPAMMDGLRLAASIDGSRVSTRLAAGTFVSLGFAEQK